MRVLIIAILIALAGLLLMLALALDWIDLDVWIDQLPSRKPNKLPGT